MNPSNEELGVLQQLLPNRSGIAIVRRVAVIRRIIHMALPNTGVQGEKLYEALDLVAPGVSKKRKRLDTGDQQRVPSPSKCKFSPRAMTCIIEATRCDGSMHMKATFSEINRRLNEKK
jgi:hypothetical protein